MTKIQLIVSLLIHIPAVALIFILHKSYGYSGEWLILGYSFLYLCVTSILFAINMENM